MIKLGKPKGQNVQEIDFIVVNYTHQYILTSKQKNGLALLQENLEIQKKTQF